MSININEKEISILQIKNISKIYVKKFLFAKADETKVLKNINMSLHVGETLCLMGASGCGKTTLAKIIMGLEPATSGQVFLFGKDISKMTRAELKNARSKIGVIFQDPFSSLDPRMTVQEILAEPFLTHKKPYTKKMLSDILKEVGLSASDLTKYPHQFSGGQRQRIGIARALALKPQLLIADEPSSSLDVSVQAQIINLLVRIRQKHNLAMLFISHDFALCNYLCQNIVLIENGVLANTTVS